MAPPALLGILGLGTWEMLVVLLLVVVLFGSRIPAAARGLGLSIREFKKGINDAGDPDTSKIKGEDAGTRSDGARDRDSKHV